MLPQITIIMLTNLSCIFLNVLGDAKLGLVGINHDFPIPVGQTKISKLLL